MDRLPLVMAMSEINKSRILSTTKIDDRAAYNRKNFIHTVWTVLSRNASKRFETSSVSQFLIDLIIEEFDAAFLDALVLCLLKLIRAPGYPVGYSAKSIQC